MNYIHVGNITAIATTHATLMRDTTTHTANLKYNMS